VSDDTELTGITPVAPEGGIAPERSGGFFSSALGKVLVIGCAIGTLLLIAIVAFVIILGSSLFSGLTGGGTDTAGTSAPKSGTAPITSIPTSGSVASTGVVAPVPDIENRDVFTPRDPFKVIAPPTIPTETASTPGSTTSDNSLVLNDITTENGTKKAVLTYGGTVYTLAEGESVGTSPWKVLKIYTSSVVMLYGDDRVTLTIGQGITK
jgi:hypothetical protein